MRTEDRRACADCGAANTMEATSCWRCFTRFDAGPVPSVSMPPPPTSGARPGSVVRIVVGLVAAFLGFVGVQRFLAGSGVEIPETVAGVPRMHDAMAARFEDQMTAEAADYDMQVEAAAFGPSGVPDFLLIVVEGSTGETTDEMFDSFVHGMSESGAAVDSLRRDGELDGASYRCVGAEAAATGVGVCMWRADDHVGIVLDLASDTRTAEVLTSSVYRDVTG